MLKVVEDILDGKTKLAWEARTKGDKYFWAKFLLNEEKFHFSFSEYYSKGELYPTHCYDHLRNAHDKFGIRNPFNSKEECQVFYNKLLLDQASK